MIRLSVRQTLTIAALAALVAVGVMGLYVWSFQHLPAAKAASGEEAGDQRPAGRERRVSGITDPSTASDERNNIEVYRATAPGVVFITTSAGGRGMFDLEEREGAGSGVVIDDQGHILTNEHVVAGSQRVTVKLTGDRTYQARVIGTDPDTDLAVLKIEAPRDQLSAIPMGDSDQLTVGQKVLAIGNPFGLDRTLTTGVISGLQRPIHSRSRRLIEGAIQTDASINPGNSGGPLLDSHGRLIGINTMIYSPTGGSVGVGFAIPVNIAKRIAPQLISGRRIVRPRLGIGVRAISDLRGQLRAPVEQGLVVIQVEPGGPADLAGLRGLRADEYGDAALGDIIVAVDGEAVQDLDDLMRILDRRQIGDEIEVEVVRRRGRETLTVRLTAPPQQPSVKRRM